ncbi:MAG: glycerol kinase GlpK [Defluviitaleaceae bacterium]|nr:glycerol kinase GlpK [Defluviitaleaceae bacterium]
MKKYLLALDQGTTSSRAILFSKEGQVMGMAQREFTQIFPQSGWVEHDAMEIWQSQLAVIAEVQAKTGINAAEIAAAGITNQRETTIIWNKTTGKPIYNAIVWQCRRTADYCEQLKNQGLTALIKEKTGLKIDAYFSATKIKWILDNVPNARQQANAGELLFGTVDTWLLWQLTKGAVFATDYTNAARTMLFNIHTLQWDLDICEKLDIPMNILPSVKPSSHIFGDIHADFLQDISNKTSKTNETSQPVKIAGIAGDQHAALFGQCCFQPGMIKNTYGTGCFTLLNTGTTAVYSKNDLLTTIAWGINNTVEYALEGSVFVAGAAVQWLRDNLQLIQTAEDSEKYATQVADSNGVYVVPAFVGLGAPYWDQYARGTITGISRGTTKNHIIRATLESIAYQSHDVIKAMAQDTNQNIQQIKVDGGACKNNFLMQFQADILDINIVRCKVTESTALGAVFLAGLAVGFYSSKEEILQKIEVDKTFTPQMDNEQRQVLLKGWENAVKRSLSED